MQQFYTPNIDPARKAYTFNVQESKHMARVLRKKTGDVIRLTNGIGHVFWGTLNVLSPKECSVNITQVEKIPAQKVKVHIAIAPTKNMDRFEWFLEKATELGVYRITPILCARSERKQIKHERCSKIIASALKQSLRAHIPILDELTPLQKLQTDANRMCIAHCQESIQTSLHTVIQNYKRSCILIGPEGDFTNDEVKWAVSNNYHEVHLGDARLRTETAAIVGLHTALLMNAQ